MFSCFIALFLLMFCAKRANDVFDRRLRDMAGSCKAKNAPIS